MDTQQIKKNLRSLSDIEPSQRSRLWAENIACENLNKYQSKQTSRDTITKLIFARFGRLSTTTIIIIVMLGTFLIFDGPAVTKAQLLEAITPLIDLKNVSFTLTLKQQGFADQKSELCFNDGKKIKQTLQDGTVNLIDISENKSYTILSAEKKVVVLDIVDNGHTIDIFQEFNEYLASVINSKSSEFEKIENRIIDGVGTEGYKVYNKNLRQKKGDVLVWVKEDTLEPVLVKRFDKMLGVETIISNIKIDDSLDSKVDLEIPIHYTIETKTSVREQYTSNMLDSERIEERIIGLLKEWTRFSGGKFPDRISFDNLKEFDPGAKAVYLQRGWRYSVKYSLELMRFFERGYRPSSEELSNLKESIMKRILPGIAQVYHLPQDSDWRYLGKRVEYGNPEIIIFYYKPQNSNSYRAIYADLSVKDISKEQIKSTDSISLK